MARVEILWEFPLSALSFLFSRILRATLQVLVQFYGASRNTQNPQWQIVSAAFLAGPIKLLWAMSRARWNLHAIIGIAGPFEVENSLSLDLQALHQSAPSWTVVVYGLPSYKTLTSISSLTVLNPEGWESIDLQPGRYLLGLRYYHWADTITLPAVKVDQTAILERQSLLAPADINGFYRTLIQRQNLIHIGLNYYVFNLLRYRRWLSQSFVEQVFLPVPNPETQFYYGAMRPGESLQIDLDSALTTTHDLYFSLYNRTCFALDWYPITTANSQTPPTHTKSIYIIRVHPKFPQEKPFERTWVKLTVSAQST